MRIWGAKETYFVGEMITREQARVVEETLSRVPGVARVRADPATRTVSVLYQMGAVAPGTIEAAMRRMGFQSVRRA